MREKATVAPPSSKRTTPSSTMPETTAFRVALTTIVVAGLVVYLPQHHLKILEWVQQIGFLGDKTETIHVALVACGNKTEEALISVKSAMMFSKSKLHYHIFTDEHLKEDFHATLRSWPQFILRRFNYTLHKVVYPKEVDSEEWRKLFAPCASLRLFIPDLLPKVERLIYTDTDILFLRPIEELWGYLKQFNDTHMSALISEHEVQKLDWYSRFSHTPYYGKSGLNSGIILMDLNRMRAFQFKDNIINYYKKYKTNLIWKDQDLLNIVFHFNPDKLLPIDCSWNYRQDHCMYGSNCEIAAKEGASILHGNRGTFVNEREPLFKSVYETFKEYKYGDELEEGFLQPLRAKLGAATGRCSWHVSPKLFTQRVEQFIKQRKGIDIN